MLPTNLAAFPAVEPETPLAEAEYRRGYRDGWIEALNALEQRGPGVAWQRATDAAYAHWAGPLAAWQRGDCATAVFPPEMTRCRAAGRRPQEALP